MQRLQDEFIPTLAPSTDPSFMSSDAGRWFQQIADTHKEPNGHLQGMYIVSADGFGPPRLFDIIGTYPPANVLRHMDEASKVIHSRSAPRVNIAPPNLLQPYIALPEPTTSVLRLYSRIADAPNNLNSSVERDTVWVLQGEVKEMLELARSSPGGFPMPPPLMGRLVRYHLVDNLGGRTQFFHNPREVKRATFTMHAKQLTARAAKLTFAGSFAGEQAQHIYGTEGEIQGELEIDIPSQRISRFRAYATATAWGGGSGHTEMPPSGKFKIVYALMEGNQPLYRNIPPALAHSLSYLDGGYRTLPH
jgi:hypothetical protein